MKKTNLVWRLQNKLTLEDIEKMITLKIISSDEAKELTFNTSDDNEKVKTLEEQIKFLKELVDKLSSHQSPTVIWKYVETYKPSYPTWGGTTILCSSTTGNLQNMAAISNSGGIGISSGGSWTSAGNKNY